MILERKDDIHGFWVCFYGLLEDLEPFPIAPLIRETFPFRTFFNVLEMDKPDPVFFNVDRSETLGSYSVNTLIKRENFAEDDTSINQLNPFCLITEGSVYKNQRNKQGENTEKPH
jgi:hypothetical protein